MEKPPRLKPTVMPGSTPVRLVVDRDRLEALAGGAGTAGALPLLQPIIPAHLTARQALFWGHDLQESHRRLVSERLALAQEPLLREVSAHLMRLRDLLLRLDLEALARPPGFLSGVLRQVGGLIDTPAELGAARAEIDRLQDILRQALTPLAGLKDRLDRLGAEITALSDQTAAHELSAAYLAMLGPEPLRGSFAERRKSLATTLLQLRSVQAERLSGPDLPARLIQAIQAVVLVALPAWTERLARFQADRAPHLTEARELGFAIAQMIPLFPKE